MCSNPTQRNTSCQNNSKYSRASKVYLKQARKTMNSVEEKTSNQSKSLWSISLRRNYSSTCKTLTPTQSWELWCKLLLRMALSKTLTWLMKCSDRFKRRLHQMRRTQPQRNRFFWEMQICIECWRILWDKNPCRNLRKTLKTYNSQSKWERFWLKT